MSIHKVYTFLGLLLLVIAVPFTLLTIPHRTTVQEHAAGISWAFITRNGSVLQYNNTPFHFGGANMHWLGLIQGNHGMVETPQARIANGLTTAHAMNETVIRSGTLGVSVGCPNCIEPTLNHFNDTAFTSIDYAIKTARDKNIRLIIPLMDNYHYPAGGKYIFTTWRGLSNEDLFYSNPVVIKDYKNYIAHILNHVNQFTGIPLKDDPTIMAWETGNELENATGTWSDAWTEQIAKYIKSIAPNQLVADGHDANDYRDLTVSQLQLPSVDLYSSHLYPLNIARVQASAILAAQYHKVYYIGEYDWTGKYGGDDLSTFLQGIESHRNLVAGDLYWELYDNGYTGDKYTLHYPGDTPNMEQRVQLLVNHALHMGIDGSIKLTPAWTVSPVPTEKQPCMPKPYCINHRPFCFPIQPKGGWCPPEIYFPSTKK